VSRSSWMILPTLSRSGTGNAGASSASAMCTEASSWPASCAGPGRFAWPRFPGSGRSKDRSAENQPGERDSRLWPVARGRLQRAAAVGSDRTLEHSGKSVTERPQCQVTPTVLRITETGRLSDAADPRRPSSSDESGC
jgi:hypothetical protein